MNTARLLGIEGRDAGEARALRAILHREAPTRRSIARDARLSLVKVSSILGALEGRGVIRKEGKTRTSGGRPSHLYSLEPDLGYALGINVRLDQIRVAAMDCGKRLLFTRSYPLSLAPDPASHRRGIVEQICAAVDQAVASAPEPDRLMAVGLALPGMVDTQRGVWLLGLQLTGITHIEIADMLCRRYGVPVVAEDVARSLAFLELHLGAGKALRHFILLYLGLGMGTGVVTDRQLYRGFHGLAGEIGHIEHPRNSYRCTCGNVGCLETVAAPAGILRLVQDRLNDGVRSELQRFGSPGAEPLSLDKVLAAAIAGDRLALATMTEIGGFVGDACAMLIKLFNPQALILSGEVTMFSEFLRDPVQAVISRGVLPEMLSGYQTIFAPYQPEHEAHGAALLAAFHLFEGLAHEPAARPAAGAH